MNANEIRDLNRSMEALGKLGLLCFGVASGLSGLILWFTGLTVWGGLGLLGFVIEVATFVSISRWYVRNTQAGVQLFARITSKGSGSMSAGEGGITREMWAKAMGLAMAEIALKDHRDIEFINFSSRSEQSKHIVSWKMDPAKRVEELIAVAEEYYGGGTDFEAPLGQAFRDVDNSQFKKADIILVTDGDCEISEAFSEELHRLKEEKLTRLHTVVIGSHSTSMEHISDTYSALYDILGGGDEAAGKLFESV